ncbi:MAG TPA: DUF4258 domain-containing protein [Dehalococcoidia bacterium]|nr:DUF4258 domain-containing protein [Dehalococcoidia bacterium]
MNVRFHPHCRERMAMRGIPDADVMHVLEPFHSSFPARPLPGRAFRSRIYVGTVAGDDLQVSVEEGTNPPYVRTVAWSLR